MSRLVRFLCGALLSMMTVVFASPSGHAIIYINIDSPNVRKFYLALPEVSRLGPAPETVAAQLTQSLTRDLTISNLFHMMETEGLPQQGVYVTDKTVDYGTWAMAGAEFLLSVGLSVEGDAANVEFRLFDVIQSIYIAGKRYRGPAASIRTMAHRMADEIMYQLTGERGIFQTKIAFVSARSGNKEIYAMDVTGQGVEQLTRNGSINISPAWSPDGKSVVYTAYMRRNPDLYQTFSSTGRTILLSSAPGLNAAADWSPDGRRLALMMGSEGESDIFTINSDGTSPTPLVRSWSSEASPCWSPDSKEIAFVSDRAGTPQIYIVEVGSKRVRRLTFEGSYNCTPAWSPKGDKIAFAGRSEGRFHIFTIRPDGTDLRKLTRTGNNESPSWAPNGRHLAFASTQGGTYDIVVMTADGGGPWKVAAASNSHDTDPSWSPWLQ